MFRRQVPPATAFLVIVLLTIGLSAGDRPLPKPNYDLASRWMAAKVGKVVFDTSVAPRWAETSDRFWYAFETAQGRKFMLVDPLKRTKAPLWDNAKMAAMLTNITRIPYESQHLPITPATMKWVKNDTAIRFELEVPKDAEIVGEKKQEASSKKQEEQKAEEKKTDEKKTGGRQEDRREEDRRKEVDEKKSGAAGEADAEPPKTTKTLYFEYRPRHGQTGAPAGPYARSRRSPAGRRCLLTTRPCCSPAATTSS